LRAKAGVVDLHHAGGAVPVDAGALFLEKTDEFFEVGDRGDVSQGDGFVGQQRGTEDGQHGVFVAGGDDGAAERVAAVDDEVCHGVGRVREGEKKASAGKADA